MAEENLFSKDRHEWARVNKAVKSDAGLKSYVNNDPNVGMNYSGLISVMESWRTLTFNVSGGGPEGNVQIVGRPAAIFPCTYQEWAGTIDFDQYTIGVNGKKKPVHKPIIAPVAKAFRKAVSDAIHAYRAAANMNRSDKVNARPGEGVNAP